MLIDYTMIDVDTDEFSLTEPGVIPADHPVIVPPRGTIDAENEATIVVKYLPGTPKKFTKKLLVQVSHYAPEEIVISGEAGFADIMLDLPRLEDEAYLALMQEAKNVVREKKEAEDPSLAALYQGITSSPELGLQMELDRLAIQRFVSSREEARLSESTGAGMLRENGASMTSLNQVELLMRKSIQVNSDEGAMKAESMTSVNNQSNFMMRSKLMESSKSLGKKQKSVK